MRLFTYERKGKYNKSPRWITNSFKLSKVLCLFSNASKDFIVYNQSNSVYFQLRSKSCSDKISL